MKYLYKGAVYTDAGKKNNEDAALLRRTERCFAAIVADGVGGLDAGEVASGYTVKAISRWFDKVEKDLPRLEISDIKGGIERTIEGIHDDLLSISEDRGVKFGSTLTFALLTKDYYLIAQVGDSRAYLVEGKAVTRITVDQTVAQYEKDSGKVLANVEEERKEHTLMQCLGQREVTPVFYEGALPKEYQMLICSDGMSNTLTERVMGNSLFKGMPCKDTLRELTQKARKNGETDNITGVLVKRVGIKE